MTEPSSAPDPDEALLIQFQQEYEAADDKDAVLQGYCGRHARLAPRFRARAAMLPMLGRLEAEAGEPLPERFGEFRVVRPIGRGGMGRVYEARHERLNRRVAVKTIRPDRASPVAIDRFHREQRALARLHQTHIVSIFEAGEEGPVQYFAMPYIDGAALSHVVQTALHLETSGPHSKTPSLAKLAANLAAAQEEAVAGSTAGPSSGRPVGAATLPALPPEVRTKRLVLSEPYFRSVAEAMADAAEAIQHAHDAGLLHRDVKPSNLMVDRDGHCWVIDFGLAGEAPRRVGEGRPADALLSADAVTSTGVLGTPQYMAPEQWKREAVTETLDARTDVYGLGVTLYELLTLRRAFDGETNEAICAAVLAGETVSPRTLVGNVPADLAAVCRKAMQKEPGNRYATATEFAEELRRWLAGQPTLARPAWPLRRAWMWARRNKGWAAAAVMAFLCLAFIAIAGVITAAAAERGKQEQKYLFLLQQLQLLRKEGRIAGWTEDARSVVREAAQIRPGDPFLRDQAASDLAGLEASRIQRWKFGGSSVVFDPSGKRLLIGGVSPDPGRKIAGEAARLWDGTLNEPRPSKAVRSGPVTFGGDGTPLQFTFDGAGKLVLWNLSKDLPVQEFKLPRLKERSEPTLALAADGKFVASSATLADGKPFLAVWEASSGKQFHDFKQSTTALTFSPDSTLLAVGDQYGKVTGWQLDTGDRFDLRGIESNRVNVVAFGRSPWRSEDAGEGDEWLLAVGHRGGAVTVWDVGRQAVRSHCRGSDHDVFALAFSPDGMTLASAGRNDARLWDVTTGRSVLALPRHDFATGLAFTPDGRRLAVSRRMAFIEPEVSVWELEVSRGLDTLRGLAARPEKLQFSRVGKRLVCLAQDWQLAVWDLQSGFLQHVLQAPRGISADNGGLAISPDGTRLAASAGREARLWDIEKGKELNRWSLPEGFQDNLAFDSTGKKLILVRVETDDPEVPPFGNNWRQNPRLFQVRDLLGKKPAQPLSIKEFRRGVYNSVISPEGAFFVAEGLGGPQGEDRILKVFDTAKGKELLSLDVKQKTINGANLSLDAEGKVLVFNPSNQPEATLVEVPSGKYIRIEPGLTGATSPGAKLILAIDDPGVPVKRGGDKEPVLRLGIDRAVSGHAAFNLAGTHLAWGSVDGAVTICDIEEVRRRLTAIGLGW